MCAEDVAPEGLAFISANDTESGRPMLLAVFEVSGTMATYDISGSATDVATPEGPSYEPLPDDNLQGMEPTDPAITPGQNPSLAPGQNFGEGTANPVADTVSPRTSDPFGGMLFLMLVMALTGGAGLLSVLGGRKEGR